MPMRLRWPRHWKAAASYNNYFIMKYLQIIQGSFRKFDTSGTFLFILKYFDYVETLLIILRIFNCEINKINIGIDFINNPLKMTLDK